MLLIMQVPGFTYPVADMYLEDILKLIGYQDALLGGSSKPSHPNGHKRSQHTGTAPPSEICQMCDLPPLIVRGCLVLPGSKSSVVHI